MIPSSLYGTAGSYAKRQYALTKWSLKKRGIEEPVKKNGVVAPTIDEIRQKNKASQILRIEGKLKSGQRLSGAELEYLKENASELYDKAIKIMKEREQYRKSLEKCKTKDDVSALETEKITQLAAEAKTIESNPNIPTGEKIALLETISMRVAGVLKEHSEFVASAAYAKLKWQWEIDKEKDEDHKSPKKARLSIRI